MYILEPSCHIGCYCRTYTLSITGAYMFNVHVTGHSPNPSGSEVLINQHVHVCIFYTSQKRCTCRGWSYSYMLFACVCLSVHLSHSTSHAQVFNHLEHCLFPCSSPQPVQLSIVNLRGSSAVPYHTLPSTHLSPSLQHFSAIVQEHRWAPLALQFLCALEYFVAYFALIYRIASLFCGYCITCKV